MKSKTLYKFDLHPYLHIETSGKKLKITFQDGFSSYSQWHTVIVKYKEKDDQYVLMEQKNEK